MKQVSGSRKVVERDTTWSWPCEKSSFLNGDIGITVLVILNFGKQIIVSPLIYFLLYLLILLCFHVISCGVLYCLVDIVYIHL
jgi:hypothetical protein